MEDYEQFKERLAELTKTLNNNDGVYLSTIHSAKGLEFDYVFVIHMDEGKLPSKKSTTETAIDEERRLTYVAFTRAVKGLFLTCSNGEKFVSRFVKDIESQCLKLIDSVSTSSLNDFEELEDEKQVDAKDAFDSILLNDEFYEDEE